MQQKRPDPKMLGLQRILAEYGFEAEDDQLDRLLSCIKEEELLELTERDEIVDYLFA